MNKQEIESYYNLQEEYQTQKEILKELVWEAMHKRALNGNLEEGWKNMTRSDIWLDEVNIDLTNNTASVEWQNSHNPTGPIHLKLSLDEIITG